MTLSQSISSIGLFANEIHINPSNVLNAKLAHRWLLIKFCLEKPLSHIVVLEGNTSTLTALSQPKFVTWVVNSSYHIQSNTSVRGVLFEARVYITYIRKRY